MIIKSAEWEKIGDSFEDYFPLFATFWKMGIPSFTEAIPTAAVQFDKQHGGNFINFLFNPKFWNRLSTYERAFVIAHESLHVLLNHGIRSKDLPAAEARIANVAMDIVVNHTLTDYFGFDRDRIKDSDKYCWLDTVFGNERATSVAKTMLDSLKGKKPVSAKKKKGSARPKALAGQNFEYYFALLLKNARYIPDWVVLVDDHRYLDGQDSSDVVDRIMGEAKKNVQAKEDADEVCRHAGIATGKWNNIKNQKVQEKKKWATIFKKIFRNWSERDMEQWARLPRRFANLPSNIILPSEMEDEGFQKEKIKIWLFLDISGSCISMKDRFIKAYLSIPKKLFDVEVHSFDTYVNKFDIKKQEIYGGGGTSFHCIESYIQKQCREGGLKYPQAVVIFTDGFGDHVSPQHSGRWYWFLHNKTGSKLYIPKESIVHYLHEFE